MPQLKLDKSNAIAFRNAMDLRSRQHVKFIKIQKQDFEQKFKKIQMEALENVMENFDGVSDDLIKYSFDSKNCQVSAYDSSSGAHPRFLLNSDERIDQKYVISYIMRPKCRTYIDFDFKRPIVLRAIGIKSGPCCPGLDPRSIKIFFKNPQYVENEQDKLNLKNIKRELDLPQTYTKNYIPFAEIDKMNFEGRWEEQIYRFSKGHTKHI